MWFPALSLDLEAILVHKPGHYLVRVAGGWIFDDLVAAGGGKGTDPIKIDGGDILSGLQPGERCKTLVFRCKSSGIAKAVDNFQKHFVRARYYIPRSITPPLRSAIQKRSTHTV